MKQITLLLALLTGMSFLSGQSLSGQYEGTLTYQAAPLPVRLRINDDPEAGTPAYQAFLDIPQLVLAWEPIQLSADGVLTLPFGLGDFPLRLNGDDLTGVNGDFRLDLRQAKSFEYTREAISWSSDTVVLRGDLYLPGDRRSGPYPTIAMTHGANIGHRGHWEYRSWADFYLREGFAVLLYDRRGEGESTGNPSGNFIDLTADLLAGIERLRTHPAIDTAHLGVAGGSQAAYLALMAASSSTAVRFLVLSAVPAVPLDEQELHMVEYGMRQDGLSHEQIRIAQAYLRLLFYYVATGRHWEALLTESHPDPTEPWTQYIGFPETPDGLRWWRDNFDAYRPTDMLPRIGIPGLYLYGETDWITPPLENAAKLKYYLEQNPTARVAIRIFEGVGHNLERSAGKDLEGKFRWFEKHPGMLEEIRRFLVTLRL